MREMIKIGALVAVGGIFAALLAVSEALPRHRYNSAAKEIADILPRGGTFHATVDALRVFVHQHSRHSIDDEFYSHWKTPDVMARKLLDAARSGAQRPSMECSTRSKITRDILNLIGIETRTVVVFDDDADELRSHTFLDARNPQTGLWETVDPDYDIWWSDAAGGRISIADRANNTDGIVPCNAVACGLSTTNTEGSTAAKILDYMDIVLSIEGSQRTTQFTKTGDPKKVLTSGMRSGTFCTLTPKNCPSH